MNYAKCFNEVTEIIDEFASTAGQSYNDLSSEVKTYTPRGDWPDIPLETLIKVLQVWKTLPKDRQKATEEYFKCFVQPHRLGAYYFK